MYNIDNDGIQNYDCSWTNRSRFKKRHIVSAKNKDEIFLLNKYYDDDGKLSSSTKTINYKLDGNKKIIAFENYDEINKETYKYFNEYKYDSLGNMIEQKNYDENKKLKFVALTTYQYY